MNSQFLLVWRVRLWLVVLAVGLVAANQRAPASRQVPQLSAAEQVECSAPGLPAATQGKALGPHAPAAKHCAQLDGKVAASAS